MITFEEVKELFKESIDTKDNMNQALENLIQSIYLKGYNEALEQQDSVLDKIRTEIDRIYEREGNSSDCLNALDELKWFINKCNAESEDKE